MYVKRFTALDQSQKSSRANCSDAEAQTLCFTMSQVTVDKQILDRSGLPYETNFACSERWGQVAKGVCSSIPVCEAEQYFHFKEEICVCKVSDQVVMSCGTIQVLGGA